MMEETGMRVSKDYFMAFSPEREDPGNASHEMYSIPKLVGE
jgi:UDP-N-acetyl-D-glucosamine dehydrogenase